MKTDDLFWVAVAILAVGGIAGAEDLLSAPEQQINNLADAIEFAEGYGTPGAIPTVLNNPGDLTVDITGTGIGNQNGFIQYGSYADGRAALVQQVSEMLNNTSSIYNSSMTIAQVSQLYTTTQQSEWAQNVATYLGVTTGTQLSAIPSTPLAS